MRALLSCPERLVGLETEDDLYFHVTTIQTSAANRVMPNRHKTRQLIVNVWNFKLKEEAALGWMEERTDEDAKAEFGDRLFIAALAVVVEPTKLRVVRDGSHVVQVNNRIRPRIRSALPARASFAP